MVSKNSHIFGKSRILTTDYEAKTNKIGDFAYGRDGMRKLGFFQQKLKFVCEDAKVRIFKKIK